MAVAEAAAIQSYSMYLCTQRGLHDSCWDSCHLILQYVFWPQENSMTAALATAMQLHRVYFYTSRGFNGSWPSSCRAVLQ